MHHLSPVTLSTIQSTVATALRSHAALSAVTVIADDGNTRAEQEDALAAKGAVLVVSPALSVTSGAKIDDWSAIVAEVGFAVHFRTSPRVNASVAGAKLYPDSAIPEILKAVRSVNAGGAKPCVVPSQSIAVRAEDDDGLLSYSLLFEARLRLSL